MPFMDNDSDKIWRSERIFFYVDNLINQNNDTGRLTKGLYWSGTLDLFCQIDEFFSGIS